MTLYLDILAQSLILVCGVSALWLVNASTPATRRWGPVLGLIGQPFWLLTTVLNGQWFIAFLCLFYTAAWWRGFRAHWLTRSAG